MVRIKSYPSKTRIKFASMMLGLALGVILALYTGAPSRWLIRLQAHLAVPSLLAQATTPELSPLAAGGSPTPQSEAAFRIAAEAMPDDAMAQLAQRMRDVDSRAPQPEGHDCLAALLPIATRFPHRPDVIAAVLRHAAGTNIQVTSPVQPEVPSDSVRANDIAICLKLAEHGERLEPKNAVFPTLKAVVLFAAKREPEAIMALEAASRLPDWNEYTSDEVRGAWSLGDFALGWNNTMARAGILASISFSHYGPIRDAARLAASTAGSAENNNNTRRGYAIRKSLLRLGALMRVKSTTFAGASTGAAVQDIAISGLDGWRGKSSAMTLPQRRAAFLHYLDANGFDADSAWVKEQFVARDTMWSIEREGFHRFDIRKGLDSFGQWVVAGLVFLDSALWVLFFGVLSALFSRLFDSDSHRRPRIPWEAGITAGLVFVSTVFWMVAAKLTMAPRTLLSAVALATVGVFIWLAVARGWRGLAKAVLVTLCALPAAALLAAMVLWLGRGFAAVEALLSTDVSAAYSASDTAPGLAALGLVVALFVAVVVAVGVWLRREPLIRGFARDYAAFAVPVACALVVVYGGIAVRTVRMSVAINRSLEKIVQHEGRFYADLAGKPWPK